MNAINCYHANTMVQPSNIKTTSIRKEKVAKDTYSFYFEKPNGFSYAPGQCMKITLPYVINDPRGPRRFFTISSSPLEKELAITTKIIHSPSIFKQQLLLLEKGDEVVIFGPMGSFFLSEKRDSSLIFLAGGIGITPFYSMVKFLSKSNSKTIVHLFVSFRNLDEAVFYEELLSMSKENSSLKVIYSISSPTKDSNWKGERGRITPQLIEKYVPDYQSNLFFICGPEKMVETMKEMVVLMGVRDEEIVCEQFSGY